MTLSITDTTHHTASKGERDWWTCTRMGEFPLTKDDALVAMELADIVGHGRDDKETTNYAYLTWERIKELAGILGLVPLKTVLYLESLEQDANQETT